MENIIKSLCFRCKKTCKEDLITGEIRFCPNYSPTKFVYWFWAIKLLFVGDSKLTRKQEKIIRNILSQAAIRSLNFAVFSQQNDYQIAIEDLIPPFATLFGLDEEIFGKIIWRKAIKQNEKKRISE